VEAAFRQGERDDGSGRGRGIAQATRNECVEGGIEEAHEGHAAVAAKPFPKFEGAAGA
jgi:hypothetical protein